MDGGIEEHILEGCFPVGMEVLGRTPSSWIMSPEMCQEPCQDAAPSKAWTSNRSTCLRTCGRQQRTFLCTGDLGTYRLAVELHLNPPDGVEPTILSRRTLVCLSVRR